MELDLNKKVVLKTFNGKNFAPKNVKHWENYWKLIGEKGEIINDCEFNEDRVLVLFENDLDKLNVENHNPIKNSLYILKTDLKILP